MARFGRTVADQVIDAVGGRLGAARRPGVAATLGRAEHHRCAGGRPERGNPWRRTRASRMRLEAVSGWLRGDTLESRAGLSGSQAVSERDLLAGTAFSMTGETDGGGLVALWGRGATTSFDGRESSLSVDGEVANLMFGADWSGGALTAGLMLSHARGSGGYRGESDDMVESTLTGVYPYGRYAASERVTVWGVAGYGAGALTLKQEGAAPVETDMDLMMAGVGLRGVVMEAPEGGGPELAVKSDAMAARTTSDAVQGLEAATAEVTRLRLGLEGGWRVTAAGGGEFVPRLEVGVRHDGGDAETGLGVDIGGGDAETGLGVDIGGGGGDRTAAPRGCAGVDAARCIAHSRMCIEIPYGPVGIVNAQSLRRVWNLALRILDSGSSSSVTRAWATGPPPTMPEPPTPARVAFVRPAAQRRSTNSGGCRHGTDSIQVDSLARSVRSLLLA